MFWDKLIKNRKFNLNNFRNTKKHNIFANWSPYERGLTFHNYLIYNFLKTIPKLKLSKKCSVQIMYYKAPKLQFMIFLGT